MRSRRLQRNAGPVQAGLGQSQTEGWKGSAVGELTQPPTPEWDRRPRESARPFEAARVYFEMGPARSLTAVAKRLQKQVRLIERWSARWGWVQRAVAYDDHMANKVQEEIEKEAQADAAKWSRRAEEDRESDYQRAHKIEAKVDKMLEFPLSVIIREDGKTIIKPAPGWKLANIPRLLATASDLKKRARSKSSEGPVEELVKQEFKIVPYRGDSGD